MKGEKYLSRASAYLFLYLYICVGFYAYFLIDCCYVVNKGIPFALEHNQRKWCKYIYVYMSDNDDSTQLITTHIEVPFFN